MGDGAMGGGKTHNMLALDLLAQNPVWRKKIVGGEFENVLTKGVMSNGGKNHAHT
jgi:hypothetical protein